MTEAMLNEDITTKTNNASCVQVAVRVRPMLPQEAGNFSCIECLSNSPNSKRVNSIRLGGETGPTFTFDEVFPMETKQMDVYQGRILPLVQAIIYGYNATVLAYGQTGSGKTHTIMGKTGPSQSLASSVQDEVSAGVIPRAIRNIFKKLNQLQDEEKENKSNDYKCEVRVQFLEVYGEEIRDLLVSQRGSQKLTIRDVGLEEPEVVGASEQKVESAEEAVLCLTRGMYRRVTGATAMNEASSRSHAIFSLIVEQSTDTNDDMHQHTQLKRSKFNFVDLAGSERQKRTKASGLRLKEGIDINQGLLVLGNVISALGDPAKQGKAFVPYRDSKLTRLLKGSLGGNHKTLMIACVSPSSSNMEESLNCLRYANRAKNIKNHAVVNLDATSRLIGELRSKMQLLAADLLKARKGNLSDFTVPVEVIASIADGGDGENILISENASPGSPRKSFDIALQKELHKLKAENESYRIKLQIVAQGDDDASDKLQQAFASKAADYENEIALLKAGLSKLQTTPSKTDGYSITTPRSRSFERSQDNTPRSRSESPELSRLRAQMFGSMSNPQNLDAEVEAEEKAVVEVMTKYLKDCGDENDTPIEPASSLEQMDGQNRSPGEISIDLEADLDELSNSIVAKEDLIQKLLATQEKFEAMREFYERKLREMEELLIKSEMESEKLSQELNELEKGHSSEKGLEKKLHEKQEQIAQLRKKQAELTRLTNVASRNESQIAKLRREVTEMKQKKADLQKQILNERKEHALEVQKLKKETMQKDRELNKAKMISDRRALEAEKAKNVAKSRLEHLNHLKSKFRDSEKRLRMQTLRKGVMSKAGYDPVMVGRRQSRRRLNDSGDDSVNVDTLRDFFDTKVADMGRKEALAEKLAQEWEEHLELSIQREELKLRDDSSDNLLAMNSQISYKEDRIRQLAARLGKRNIGTDKNLSVSDEETYLFDTKFKKLIGNASSESSAKVAAQVLFGMVVRERRRIATLARTASLLDERVQDAEAASVAKDEAFRSYVNEQRVEAAALAQHQQENILSLMEMVKEEPSLHENNGTNEGASANASTNGDSKLLLLANERIVVLERQLNESQTERESIISSREREEETRSLLETKTEECKQLESEISSLQAALRLIREDIAQLSGAPDGSIMDNESNLKFSQKKTLLDAIEKALRPSGVTPSRKARSNARADLALTKKRVDNFDREYNSSDGDEVPDWAEDIMNDLATIAEGKMPSVLRGSADVVNEEAQLENLNVFDRLTNPALFTGVQKKKVSERPVRKAQISPNSKTGEKKKKEVVLDVQTQESIVRLLEPAEDDSHSRSVFDRLMSPSNATGTQKQRLQSAKKQNRPETEDNVDDLNAGSGEYNEDTMDFAERLNNTTSRAYEVKEQVRRAEAMLDNVLETHLDEEASSEAHAGSSTKVQEYTQQNVFERLQKTTTRAYEVRQTVAMAERVIDSALNDENKKGPLADFSNLPTSVSKSETMETGSVCSNQSNGTHRSTLSMSKQNTVTNIVKRKPKPAAKEYGNVFERLHHTTIEAKNANRSNPDS